MISLSAPVALPHIPGSDSLLELPRMLSDPISFLRERHGAHGLRGSRQSDLERAAARAPFQVLLEQRFFELGELAVEPERCPLAGTLAATIAR